MRSFACYSFIKITLFKGHTPLFNPKITQEWKENQLDLLSRWFDYLTERLKGKPYLMGEQFTVADAYLFTVLNWSNLFKVDLGKWPILKDYITHVAARPAVREAMRAEGLTE
jgi:glutathione S-transferase